MNTSKPHDTHDRRVFAAGSCLALLDAGFRYRHTDMKRLNFTLDDATLELLERLAAGYFSGNKSLAVRSALESLAAHAGHEGWVIAGYTPVMLDGDVNCHTCGDAHRPGEVLFRPVFERGDGPQALAHIPSENWLDCPGCVEHEE